MAEHTPQYLRVIGRLQADRQLTLRLGYLTETPPWSDSDGDSPLRAEVFDDQGGALGSYPLRLAELCMEGARVKPRQSVRGFVPFHPRARRIVFSYRGQPVHEIARSDAPPRARWSWEPGRQLTGMQTLTWTGDHPNGLPVEFFVRYSWDDGRSWSRLSVATQEFSLAVDFDQLPGGERCVFALVATDGINTTIVESARFTLPRKGCVALILQPLDGAHFASGEPVPFQGQGFWREESRPEWEQLTWHTSSDTQPVLRGRLGQLQLPPGQHVITLLAGSEPHQGRAQVTITVGSESAAAPSYSRD
ncbi:MAG: hypothetical protein ABI051_12090 [Vicinamibacterales bacterium]